MRCPQCGWPNKPGIQNCVKCGMPLSEEDVVPVTANEFENEPSCDASSLGKTVMESRSFYDNPEPQRQPVHMYQPQTASDDRPAGNVCKKCGYMLRPNADKCPNCQYPVGGHAVPASANGCSHDSRNNASVPNNRPTCPRAGNVEAPAQPAPRHGGTVNPYMMNIDATPACSLKPVGRMNERREPETQEYEGTEVILNRSNTDPVNTSITSREQAILTNDGGHWYIEDRSEQKTTFVQASRKTELHDGDMILLGNRLFEFHE